MEGKALKARMEWQGGERRETEVKGGERQGKKGIKGKESERKGSGVE